MKSPTDEEFLATMEVTWPPASRQAVGDWTIRDGCGGGKRVSAATGHDLNDIGAAEAAMAALGQPDIFMIRKGDGLLDQALQDRGYKISDPVTCYGCPIEAVVAEPASRLTAFAIWPPLAIMNEIWAAGGIGPERLAVMARVKSAKTAILGRAKDRAAGTAFVAIHREMAMIHAIEVTPEMRRNGVAINIMRTAAHWAQDRGARYFALLVTDANAPANALYKKLGLSVVGQYHYRVRQK